MHLLDIDRRDLARADGLEGCPGVLKEAQIPVLIADYIEAGLEYRIIAVNKAGESPPSNSIIVVL